MKLVFENQTVSLDGIKAVIFDLDGTLVESEPVWMMAKKTVSRKYGHEIGDSVLQSFVGRSVVDFVREAMGIQNAEPVAAEIHDLVMANFEGSVVQIHGAAALVDALHKAGLTIAICSSASDMAIGKSLKILGVSELVSLSLSTTTLARGKPDRLPYDETLKRLGIAAHQAIVFEDALAGVQSAIGAGISTVAVGAGYASPEFLGCVMRVAHIGDINVVR